MKLFQLHRTEDISGISGTGTVAEGVQFTDGTVAVRWLNKDIRPTTVIHDDIESVITLHGHGGATQVVWL